jgi:hypothetical protein
VLHLHLLLKVEHVIAGLPQACSTWNKKRKWNLKG